MFSTVTTYICNGCMTKVLEHEAIDWTHLNNSPNDGTISMDFCPACINKLKATLFNNTISVNMEPVPKATTRTSAVKVKQEPIIAEVEEPIELEIEQSELKERDERFVDFYKRLYTRVIYDIACDHEITSCIPYLPYIPGKLTVDKRSTIDDTQVIVIINGKRVRIVKDANKIGATVITIYNGASIVLTRKVSTFEGVKTLIQDISTTEVNLLPIINVDYTVAHLNNVLNKLNNVDDGMIPVDELKNWIVYTAEISGIPLN